MPASSIFSAYLSFCIRQTVCALIHCWVGFMCAYLNGFQCAVIFCVVVMSAIVNGTSDTFITFFHEFAPPFIWYDDSMTVSMIKNTAIFYRFLLYYLKRKGAQNLADKSKKSTTKRKKTSTKTKSKKLSVSLDAETMELLEEYLTQFGYSKEAFVQKAILEKISRDKISAMIDTMIQ